MRKASVDPNLQAMFRRFAQANREKSEAGGWKFFFLKAQVDSTFMPWMEKKDFGYAVLDIFGEGEGICRTAKFW